MTIRAEWAIESNGHVDAFIISTRCRVDLATFPEAMIKHHYEAMAAKVINDLGATLLTGTLVTHPEDLDE